MDPKTLLEIAQQHFTIKEFRAEPEERARIEAAGTPFVGDKYRLDAKPKICTDCGILTKDRRVTYVLKQHEHREVFWEKKCWVCKDKKTANSLKKIMKK